MNTWVPLFQKAEILSKSKQPPRQAAQSCGKFRYSLLAFVLPPLLTERQFLTFCIFRRLRIGNSRLTYREEILLKPIYPYSPILQPVSAEFNISRQLIQLLSKTSRHQIQGFRQNARRFPAVRPDVLPETCRRFRQNILSNGTFHPIKRCITSYQTCISIKKCCIFSHTISGFRSRWNKTETRSVSSSRIFKAYQQYYPSSSYFLTKEKHLGAS